MLLPAVSAPIQSVRAVCCAFVALHHRVVTDVDWPGSIEMSTSGSLISTPSNQFTRFVRRSRVPPVLRRT